MKRTLARIRGRSRHDDERGAVLILTAVAAVLVIAASALAVDYGGTVAIGTNAQSVADAAAMDTAQYLNTSGANLTTEADNSATRNGFAYSATGNSLTANSGCWDGSAFTALGAVEPGGATCSTATSVKVIVKTPAAHFFAGGSQVVQRSAIASAIPVAGFMIGTTLATVNSSQSTVLNSLFAAFTSTPGTPISGTNIGLVGYQGLASTGVTLNQLITASGGVLTPSNVLSASLTGSQLATFFGNALGSEAAALTASGQGIPTTLTNAINFMTTFTPKVSAPSSITLCQVLTVNGSGCTVSSSALQTNVNVLQALTTAADVANGSSGINLTTALNIAGDSVKLTTSVVHPPQYAFGGIGSTATTSQVTEQLTITLANVLGNSVAINIPITAAAGTATLNSLNCANNAASSVGIGATTNALSETSGSNEPAVVVTVLGSPVSVPLPLTVGATGSGNLTFTPPYSQTNVQYVPNPPTAPTVTIGAGNYGPLGLVLGPAVSAVVSPVVSALESGANPLLDTILQATGVSVDQATVAVPGANCSYPVLAG